MSRDMRLPQFPQVVEQRNRVRTGIEHLAVRLENDLKCRTNLGSRLRFPASLREWIVRRRDQSCESAGCFHFFWRDGKTPFTRQVKGLFHLVSEPGKVRETCRCPGSLDGVNGPEHPVYQRRIARFRLQRQEGRVEFNQQVQRL